MAAACASSCLRETGEPMIVLRCRRGRDDECRGGGRVGKEQRPGRQGKRGRRSPLPTRVLQGFATPRTTRSSLPLLSGIANCYRFPLSLSLSLSRSLSSPSLDQLALPRPGPRRGVRLRALFLFGSVNSFSLCLQECTLNPDYCASSEENTR